MTKKPSSSLVLLLLLLLLVPRADATIGMCVPTAAAHLVDPAFLVNLLKAHSISMVRLFAPVPSILTALKGTGIRVMVGVGNDQIVPLSLGGQDAALRWLKMHVLAFLDPKQLRYLGVGNEVLHVAEALIIPHVVPAMNNLHKALQQLGLDGAVKISSPLASSILGVSMPPSSGAFTPLSLPLVRPMLKFLQDTGSPLMVNTYPFQNFIQNPLHQALNFFLFHQNAPPVKDDGRSYTNILDVIVDALVAAMQREGFSGIPVSVTGTGWPMQGNNKAATPANAAAFVHGVVQRALEGTGTPMRPKQGLEVFLSNMFNHQNNSGNETNHEVHLGVFNLDGTTVVNATFGRAH
ncbi:glucan endo-1,3-beta-glucosidase-like [Musa acuminata AAA Group]|uniref:glucan endo-1,3-beta-glucosidase-like n=1 Tax=Musa acuminata AAA Group TaxID=214697 RepID=UPI0031D7A932